MEIISSRQNKNVRAARELLRDREYRRESGAFAAEGDHLCGEIAELAGNGDIELFLFTEKAAAKYPGTLGKLGAKCENGFCITEEISEYISDTKAPQGIFCAARRGILPRGIPEAAGRIIVLDGLQDPGNIGTIIRTAEAFGFDGVITAADVCSPKILRASMGSVLRIPCAECSANELRERLAGFAVFAAMLDEGAKRLGEVKFPEKTAIVVGSEGAGVSAEIAALCDEKIYIPIKGAESLNAAAAAAVLMWEARKTR